MQSVVRSKDAKRRELAALPIEGKLRMLDVLRERTVTLQSALPSTEARAGCAFGGGVGDVGKQVVLS